MLRDEMLRLKRLVSFAAGELAAWYRDLREVPVPKVPLVIGMVGGVYFAGRFIIVFGLVSFGVVPWSAVIVHNHLFDFGERVAFLAGVTMAYGQGRIAWLFRAAMVIQWLAALPLYLFRDRVGGDHLPVGMTIIFWASALVGGAAMGYVFRLHEQAARAFRSD